MSNSDESAAALARVAQDFGLSVEVARTVLAGARGVERYAAELRAQLRLEADGLVPPGPLPFAAEELAPDLVPKRRPPLTFADLVSMDVDETVRHCMTRTLNYPPPEPDSWPEVVRAETEKGKE